MRLISRLSDEFTVLHRGEPIGHSSLEWLDSGMGVASGEFVPLSGYAEVRPVFRLFTAAIGQDAGRNDDKAVLARYYQTRDALGLELRDPDGRHVPTNAIHIVDLSLEVGPDAYQLEVHAQDRMAWALVQRGRDVGESARTDDL